MEGVVGAMNFPLDWELRDLETWDWRSYVEARDDRKSPFKYSFMLWLSSYTGLFLSGVKMRASRSRSSERIIRIKVG